MHRQLDRQVHLERIGYPDLPCHWTPRPVWYELAAGGHQRKIVASACISRGFQANLDDPIALIGGKISGFARIEQKFACGSNLWRFQF